MLTSLIISGRQQVAQAGRRAALGLAGVLAILPGLGFLTHAAWSALAALHGAAIASLLIGGMWSGVGVILLAFAVYGAPRPAPPPPMPALNHLALVEAFITGFSAARSGPKG